MLKFLHRISFKNSNYLKQALVLDVSPIDSSMNDVPEQCLDTDVSPLLNVKYLSQSKQNEQKIKSQPEYRGAIVGNLNRLFVSIPVAQYKTNKFVNVHFLLNTASPNTTLTKRALCAIHQKPFPSEQIFTRYLYQIGGKVVYIQLSDSKAKYAYHGYPSINVLGMDFLKRFQEFNIKYSKKELSFDLKLLY